MQRKSCGLLTPREYPFSALFPPNGLTPIPVLVIEADPPDGSAFNRAYYYCTALTLMGEMTYQQRVHIDIHADKATESICGDSCKGES